MPKTTTKRTIAEDLLPAMSDARLTLTIENPNYADDLDGLETVLDNLGFPGGIDALLGHWFTDRGPRGLRVRASHTGAKVEGSTSAYEVIAAGFAMLKWHTTSGSIDSLMIARFRVGAKIYEQLETLTTVLAVLLYGRSPASQRWDAALGRGAK